MAAIAPQLQAVIDGFTKSAPDAIKNPIVKSVEEHKSTFDTSKVIQAGDKFPDFKLTNATGKEISRSDILAKGAFLVTFYRGNWCPFCNVALHGLQDHHAQFQAKGIQLVAISPELPDNTLTTVEKNELKFEVLSDTNNKLAKEMNIVWKMPDYLRQTLLSIGTDISARHGDDAFEVPVPTNILVDKTGTVRNVHVDPDYRSRLEPATALEWANAL